MPIYNGLEWPNIWVGKNMDINKGYKQNLTETRHAKDRRLKQMSAHTLKNLILSATITNKKMRENTAQ